MSGKLEKFIASHADELDHRAPDPAVLARIQQQMAAGRPRQKTGVVISFRTLRWSAAAACLVLVLGVAFWKLDAGRDSASVKVTKAPQNVQPQVLAPDTATNIPSSPVAAQPALPIQEPRFAGLDREIAARKARVTAALGNARPASYKQALFAKLGDLESPAGRINVLSETGRFKSIGKDVTNVLVHTMNTDPNTNVRLAALEGLAKFYREDYVKTQLIASLKKQHDPMVQIALIGLLTRMKEAAILADLERMINDEETLDAVKETAYTGLYELKRI